MATKRKPGRPGTPTTTNADRGRKMVTITMAPETIARLDRQAKRTDTTRSGLVEWAVLAYLDGLD